MSRADLLLILTIVFGFPGICLMLSLPPYRVVGILLLVLAVLSLVFWRFTNLPLWTIIELHRTIIIKKHDGTLATSTKRTRMRANHKGLTQFIHKNIRADGSIRNFRLDSVAVSPDDIKIRAGEYMVYERFKMMNIWQSRTSCLSYDLYNSFPSGTEGTGYIPDYFTKKYEIEMDFPPKRTARNPRAYTGIGAETKELNKPVLSSDGRKIRWEGKNLKPGQYYTIEWDW